MIDLACPSCGRAGQVPREKLHSRLVCKKCHVVFHMDTSGRPVVGEPHHGPSKDPTKQKTDEHHALLEGFQIPKLSDLTNFKENLTEYTFPVKPVLGVLGVILVGWVAMIVTSGPGESVADRAKLAVDGACARRPGAAQDVHLGERPRRYHSLV